ncbi:MAG: EAL domain-containing protein [Caulobacterales bacterium]|nr:EAL domain-containing protein [Caulobacterales bacterium]
MDLKAQRDRFMAFCFASADLLIETDARGAIVFAMGAASAFGSDDAEDLCDRVIGDLFVGADRSLLDHIVATLKPGRRIGPVLAHPSGSRAAGDGVVMIGGCALPNAPDRRYFTIAQGAPPSLPAANVDRDPGTGLIQADDYEEIARETLDRARREGRHLRFTFLTLAGQDELAARLGEREQTAMHSEIGALLRAASVGDAAALIGEGRFSILHEADLDTDALRDELVSATAKNDPEGRGAQVSGQTLPIDPDTSADDAARSIAYAVKAVANGDRELAASGEVSDMLCSIMRDANTRIVEFKKVLCERRFGFVAQPVVRLSDMAVSHYELLVRFERDRSPFEQISFAERMGIVAELDITVLEAALGFLEHRAPTGFPGLAVNVSGLSIVNSAFMSCVNRLLDATAAPSSQLVFEITESAEMTDLTAADRNIASLRRRGHLVCLDDFGAGAASFPYLRALTVDAVKIDGAYVREALQTRRDAMLLKAMAGLCRDLRVTTIAEMVETADQLSHLQDLGIDKGQGWLFGKPVALGTLSAKRAA